MLAKKTVSKLSSNGLIIGFYYGMLFLIHYNRKFVTLPSLYLYS